MTRLRAADLEAILTICKGAAEDAGAFVRTGYRKQLVVEHKGAIDLVTHFDRESELRIRQRLTSALPYGVVGEEEGGKVPPSGPVFYVDPLDGTTNFVHGHPFWCISIGLVEDGDPILGVVVAPILGLAWYGYVADDGRRAMRRAWGTAKTEEPDELPCAVSTNGSFSDALLATGFPYDRRTSSDNNFDAFVTIKKRVQAVRRCGSAALDLCFVADGTYEGYWEKKLGAWDIAAGIAIVKAAGGRVTDMSGTSNCIASGNVVATNAAIHDALLNELANVQPLPGG